MKHIFVGPMEICLYLAKATEVLNPIIAGKNLERLEGYGANVTIHVPKDWDMPDDARAAIERRMIYPNTQVILHRDNPQKTKKDMNQKFCDLCAKPILVDVVNTEHTLRIKPRLPGVFPPAIDEAAGKYKETPVAMTVTCHTMGERVRDIDVCGQCIVAKLQEVTKPCATTT